MLSLLYGVLAQPVPNGPWVDEIAFFEEKEYAKVVDMLDKGDADIFLFTITDPDLVERIKTSPNIDYKVAYGLFNELTLNPAEFKTGEFNPFVNPRIREALNWVIDRNYIVKEIYKGLARPKWVSFISAFPEYGRLADIIKLLEAKYAYDFEKGKSIIFEEMAEMGAELKDGKWHYNDKPVVIRIIIRVEDERKLIGDYAASQLEKLGFTVERLYRTRREAGALVYAGDPTEGKWHIYTGGWISTSVSRWDPWDLGFFYTPLGYGAFMKYAKPDPILMEVASKLWRGEWKTIEERQELMAKGVELALKDSLRVWLVDQLSPYPYRVELEGAADLSGGFTTALWSRTVRFKDQVGGTVKAASLGVLVDPWNPVAGTNWLYDALVLWCVNDYALLANPYTGLPMPNRVVSVEMEVEEGVPTIATSPWLELKFVPQIEVPSDAWYEWDVEEKKIVGPPPGTFAKAKVVVNYGSVIGKVKYHDGSVMSLADWFALWPLTFERVNPDSPLYDESAEPGFREWRLNFRGLRIVSEDPLVVEYYINYTHLEAEFMADWAAGWPNMPWHATAMGILAEEKGLLSFSDYKANKMKNEWMNYIGGPSLKVLEDVLNEALETGYIPFKEHASKYITPEDAKARYQNLKNWYEEHGHFWVASGPFYLETADFTAHIATVKAFREYTFKADRWAWLAEPPIPEVTVEVPENVVPGIEAQFAISVTLKGEPLPSERMEFVKYLVLDSEGNVLLKGEATPGAPGQWQIKLSSTDTGKFAPGTYRLMYIALSKDVAIPAIEEVGFTVIPEISYFQSLIAETESTLSAKISGVEASITETTERISELEGAISGLQTTATASIAVAVIAILIALYAVVAARRR